MKNFLVVSSLCFCCFISVRANAAIVPPINISAYVFAYTNDCCNTTQGPNASQSSEGAYSKNTTDLSKAPSISAYSTARLINTPPNDINNSASSANVGLAYYLEINAPVNTVVPLLVQASGTTHTVASANRSGIANAKAFFGLSIRGNYLIEENIESDLESSKSFFIDQYLELPTNTLMVVEMATATYTTGSVWTSSQDQDTELRTAFATVDPYFQIDSAYKGYSLVFSEGINNIQVSSVPLPASAPLFGAALLGLGVFGYRMKRTRGVAAV